LTFLFYSSVLAPKVQYHKPWAEGPGTNVNRKPKHQRCEVL